MQTETKAVQPIHNYDTSKDKLMADLKVVAADAQQLIKEAADSSSESFAALRTRVEGKLDETRVKLVRARTVMNENARLATDTTVAYVKENPWKFVGAIAAASVFFGMLLGRRKPAPNTDASDKT